MSFPGCPDELIVDVLEVRRGKVSLGFTGPTTIRVRREEIAEEQTPSAVY